MTVRAMRQSDVGAAVEVDVAAFAAYDRALGRPPESVSEADLARFRRKFAHLQAHDPAGAWVAVDGDRLVGVALALRRDDLWGLSLLVVDPQTQSAGHGRRLLDAALGYARGCRRGIILSSQDHRAIRLYATSGFVLHPQMRAAGKPDRSTIPAPDRRVRDGSVADVTFADDVDRRVRRAARGPDQTLLAETTTMFVVDDLAGHGYAYCQGARLSALAATDEVTATALLWRYLAHVSDIDGSAVLPDLNAGQQWAIRTAYSARLRVEPGGPVFWRGDSPPPAYLPSGAFL